MLESHGKKITAIAFSPEGRMVASSDLSDVSSPTVWPWDVITGKNQKLQGHCIRVDAIAFSPDSQMVASAARDQTVLLWDATTGRLKQKFKGHSDWVISVGFSPDGTTVVSASQDGAVRLWDATTCEEKQAFQMDELPGCLSFSADRHLESNQRLLHLYPSAETAQPNALQAMDRFLMRDWVIQDGKRVLWLPPDYRPVNVNLYDNVFALGYTSGPLKMIQLTSFKKSHTARVPI